MTIAEGWLGNWSPLFSMYFKNQNFIDFVHAVKSLDYNITLFEGLDNNNGPSSLRLTFYHIASKSLAQRNHGFTQKKVGFFSCGSVRSNPQRRPIRLTCANTMRTLPKRPLFDKTPAQRLRHRHRAQWPRMESFIGIGNLIFVGRCGTANAMACLCWRVTFISLEVKYSATAYNTKHTRRVYLLLYFCLLLYMWVCSMHWSTYIMLCSTCSSRRQGIFVCSGAFCVWRTFSDGQNTGVDGRFAQKLVFLFKSSHAPKLRVYVCTRFQAQSADRAAAARTWLREKTLTLPGRQSKFNFHELL